MDDFNNNRNYSNDIIHHVYDNNERNEHIFTTTDRVETSAVTDQRQKRHRKRHVLPGPAGLMIHSRNDNDNNEEEDQTTMTGEQQQQQGQSSFYSWTQPQTCATTESRCDHNNIITSTPAWKAMCISLNRFIPSTTTTTTIQQIKLHLPTNFVLLSDILLLSSNNNCFVVAMISSVQCHLHCDWTCELVDETNTKVIGWLEESFIRRVKPEVITRPGAVLLLQNVVTSAFLKNQEYYDDDNDNNNNNEQAHQQEETTIIEEMLLIGEETVIHMWLPEDGLNVTNEQISLHRQQQQQQQHTSNNKRKRRCKDKEEVEFLAVNNNALCSLQSISSEQQQQQHQQHQHGLINIDNSSSVPPRINDKSKATSATTTTSTNNDSFNYFDDDDDDDDDNDNDNVWACSDFHFLSLTNDACKEEGQHIKIYNKNTRNDNASYSPNTTTTTTAISNEKDWYTNSTMHNNSQRTTTTDEHLNNNLIIVNDTTAFHDDDDDDNDLSLFNKTDFLDDLSD